MLLAQRLQLLEQKVRMAEGIRHQLLQAGSKPLDLSRKVTATFKGAPSDKELK